MKSTSYKTRRALALAALASAIGTLPAKAQLRAFGDAEGYGANASGGRSGTIYHVTTLANSGSGSFRDAVSVSNRIIVFDVGGVINLNSGSAVSAQSNLTILGQTAPGAGIAITGAEVSFDSKNNDIMRYMRIRPGDPSVASDDALALGNANNVIIDHTSMEFGKWNNIDAVSDSTVTANVTIQNSIIADPISNGTDNRGQGFGAHLEAVKGFFTLSNNLWASGHSREPLAKVNEQFKNNIEYNNETGYLTSGTSTPFNHDVVNNAFIFGPASTSSGDFGQLSTPDTFYATGNVQDTNQDGVWNPTATAPSTVNPLSPTPLHASTTALPTLSAADAYTYVMSHVGASLSRDQLDSLLIGQVQTLGSGPAGFTAGTAGPAVTDVPLDVESPFAGHTGLYHKASDTGLDNGGLGTIALTSNPAGFDTDGDGVPDSWETAHGMNPNVADSLTTNPLGYRMIEQYANDLVKTNIPVTSVGGASGEFSAAGNWSGSTIPGVYDYAQVRGDGVNNGSLAISAGTSQMMTLSIGGNGPAGGENVTVNGGKLYVYDTTTIGDQNNGAVILNSGTFNSYAIQLGNTVFGASTTTYTGSLTINGGVVETANIALGGGSPGAWTTGGSIIFNAGTISSIGTLSINAPISLGGNVNIDTNGNDGTISGNITGTGSLTKWDNGAATLSGNNTITGSLSVRGGTLNLSGTNSISNGVFMIGGSVGIGSDANLGGTTTPISFQGGLLRINGNSLGNIDSHAVNWSTFNGGFEIASASNTFTVASTVSGNGSMSKSGPGVLLLTASNSYTGGTALNAGVLGINNVNNIGGAGKTLTFAGGELRVLGTSLANLDNMNVNWSSFNGSIDVNDPTNTFAVNSVIGGSGGLTKDGAGTLVLNAPNTFTGNTIVNAGVLKLGNALAIQNSTLNFPGTGGALDLNGFSLNIGGIAGSGGFDLGGGVLTVGDNNLSTTFSGVISDTVGGGKLVKIGTGILTLTGASTYALNLVANGGGGFGVTANVAASGNTPFGTSNAGVLLDGGKLTITSSSNVAWDRLFTLGPGGGTLEANSPHFVFNSTGTVPFSGTGNSTLTLSGSNVDNELKFKLVDPAGGKLSVNKVGSGRWILTVGSGQAWTYSGDTTINGGTLIMNSSNAILPFGPGKGNLVITSGTFSMNGRSNVQINGLSGPGTVVSGTNFTIGNGDASASFSGHINSVTGVTKTGAGLQIFSGSNGYSGATNINGGVLQFNAANTIGGSGATVTVTSPGIAAAGYAMDQAFLNRIVTTSTGAVALAANSSNALSLSGFAGLELGGVGSVSYTGVLTPNGTTYRLGAGTGTIVFPNANALTGARDVQIFPGGTVSLANSNNYTGATTINSGGILLAKSITNDAPLTINSGSVLMTSKAQPLDPTGTSIVSSLSITSGKLDLANNGFIVDWSAASPINTIAQQIQTGSITSSALDANHNIGFAEASSLGLTSFGGVNVDASAVVMRATINGDANLNGAVDTSDFTRLANHFGQSAAGWSDGDFNRDGVVNALDFNALATHFGQTMTSAALGSLVPEPASISLLLGIALLAPRRRRR